MNMKKSIKITVFCVFIVVIACAGIFHTDIYVRCYPKDRISGKYTVTLDGETIDYVVRYTSDSQNQVKPCGENGTVGIKGGEYGVYKVIFSPVADAGKSLPDIELEIFNTNWWNIINFELSCDLKQVGDEYTLDASLAYSYYSVDTVLKRESYKTSLSLKVEKEDKTAFMLQISA